MNIKINVLAADILQKPQGSLLLIPHFQDVDTKNNLFIKVDRLLNNRLTKKSKQFGFKSEKKESFIVHGADNKLEYDEVFVFGLGKKKVYYLDWLYR